MKKQKVNGVLYFFDKDHFGFPVECEQGHVILEINNMIGNYIYKCEKCNREYDIIVPEDGNKSI